jgi:hypothetical protein
MGSAGDQKPKKLYEPPILTVYGKVNELTRTVSIHGHTDGGSGARTRTSLH